MNISAINLFRISNNQTVLGKGFYKYNNLKPLSCDTVSFGAMKKSKFGGIDLFVVNKFKAPIEKFNSDSDFQDWCKDQVDKLRERDLEGRQFKTTDERKDRFKKWQNYVKDKYSSSTSLMILDGITSGLDDSNDVLVPPLDEDTLKLTIEQISAKLNKYPKAQINFNKEYRQNLKDKYLKELNADIDSNQTGWVVVPSHKNDPKNFDKNTQKLQILSYRTWCTASFDAPRCFKDGDFHIYLDHGKPKIGIKFENGSITEINGEQNDRVIPINYLDVVKEHIQGCTLSKQTKEDLYNSEKAREKAAKIKEELQTKGADFNTCTTEQLFDALNIEYRVDDDGLLIIDEYRQPDEDIRYCDIGINENALFKNIKEIKGCADFRNSSVKNLGALKKIGGDADFSFSKLISLQNLKEIGGHVNFQFSNVKDLGKLKNIGGDVNFRNSRMTSLNNLERIEGCADFEASDIVDLGALNYIGGNSDFINSIITSLKNLKYIGKDAYFNYSDVEDLASLEVIGGGANFENSKVTNLGALKRIDKNICIGNSLLKKEDFKDIKIGGKIYEY